MPNTMEVMSLAVDMGSAVGYLLLDTSSFKKGFTTAAEDMKTFLDKTTTTNNKLTAMSSAMTKVGTAMTKGVTLPILGVATAAMKVGNTFEAQMSRVQGISGATGDELEKLKDQAIELGAATSFSATEAAQGMENLASAGFTTNEIMEAMPGLLDLAASSGADLATASEIAASAVRGFGLEASDTAHVADVFAEAAARTNAQTEDMGEAMKYIAPVANAMGQSLEMTAAAIGIMSDAGIKGSQAGTSLRGALSRLAKPTDVMQEKMDQLGLSFYDAQGNMLPLTGIVEQLETKMAGLTQEQRNNALVTLFGQESLSGMLALMQRGSGELAEMTTQFENVDGSAASMADTMLNNTSGAIEELSGSVETLMIKIQQVMAPTVQQIVQNLTEFVNSLSALDESTLQIIVKIAAFAAAIGPVLLILGKVIGLISSISTLITGLGGLAGVVSAFGSTVGAVFTALTGPIGIAIAIIGALFVAWQTDFNGMRDTVSNVFSSIQNTISSIISIVQSIITIALALITAAWQSNFANIQGIVTAVFNTIQTTIQNAFAIIEAIFAVFEAAFKGNWQGMWDALKNLVVTTLSAIAELFMNALNLIVQILVGWAGLFLDAGMTLMTTLKNAFTSGFQAIMSWWEGAVQDPVGTILGIGGALYDAGASIFNGLWNGLKSVWDGIVGWVEDAVNWLVDKVAFWESESSKMSTGGGGGGRGRSTEGSYASGLNYVPRDMDVRVHEGEAILTKEENQSRKNNSSTGDTYIFNSPESIDAITAAREFRKVKVQIAEGLI